MVAPEDRESQSDKLHVRIKGSRLKALRRLRGLSQEKLGTISGTSNSLVSMVEHSHSRTSLQATIALADALDTSIDYLLDRVDDPRPTHEIVADLKIKVARVRDLEEGCAEPLDPHWEDHVGIEEIDATVGAGSTGTDGAVKTRLKFPHAWLRKHRLRAHLCRIVRVAGEAMEPTIPDSGLILINTASTEHRDGRIYVLRIGDDVLVRRVRLDPEAGWLLHCDNRDKATWPTQPWPENAVTVGEVRWLGRTFI